MTLFDYIAIFILLDIVGIIHIFIIKKKYFLFLNKPISKKIFGENKTYRGLIIMSLFSGILGSYYFGFIFSFLLGLFWILGEFPNSFIKRRLGIKSGNYGKGIGVLVQYIFDTLDSIIAILIFLNLIYDISVLANFLLILAGFLNHSLIDYFCYKIGIKKLNFANPLIIFFQLIVRIVFQPYLFFNSKYKKNSIKIKKDEKYICIANHISKLDPFLICSSLDLKTVFKIIPFRYMVTKSYMDKYGKLAKLVGCYPAHSFDKSGKLKHTLELSREFVERGEAVFIFPEGGIWDKKFGVGAFLLNQKIKNSKLLLFGIFRKSKKDKFKIDFLGKKDINKEKKLDKKDLLESGKIIFNEIQKGISKNL